MVAWRRVGSVGGGIVSVFLPADTIKAGLNVCELNIRSSLEI